MSALRNELRKLCAGILEFLVKMEAQKDASFLKSFLRSNLCHDKDTFHLNDVRTGQETQEFASFPHLPKKEHHVNCA